ncbi:MAG: diacylglycerol kinase [Pseudorhodobacter sp.]
MPEEDPGSSQEIPKPREGLLHLVDATLYSLAGFRPLMQETAARHELIGGAIGALLLAFGGATVGQWLLYGILFAILLAVEALNTAIEVLTNQISPQWSDAARDAKDLGSLACFLLIVANCAYVGVVFFQLI